MSVVSIRGAITVPENTKTAILEATKVLLKSIIDKNKLDKEGIISIHFTGTRDLDAVYPAVGAREIGITQSALMCFQEFYVPGSLQKCIRVEVLTEQDGLLRSNLKHQYLGETQKLRPDLAE